MTSKSPPARWRRSRTSTSSRERPAGFAVLAAAGALLGAGGAAATPPSADQVREARDEVFRRPEFLPEESDLLARIVRAIVDFFVWLGRLHEAAPLLFWLLLVGCITLLALLVFHIVWTLRRIFYVSEAGAKAAARAERLRRSEDFAREADRHAAAGDYTEAIRCLFLSLVHRFDESGRVSFRKSYTNHEYLDLVRDRAPLYEGLGVFVEALDDCWYGQRPASRELYERCRALFDRLR